MGDKSHHVYPSERYGCNQLSNSDSLGVLELFFLVLVDLHIGINARFVVSPLKQSAIAGPDLIEIEDYACEGACWHHKEERAVEDSVCFVAAAFQVFTSAAPADQIHNHVRQLTKP